MTPTELPTPLKFVEFEGRKIFQGNGADGGLTSKLFAVIVHHFDPRFYGMSFGRRGLHDEGQIGKWYVIELGYDEGPEAFQEAVKKAIAALL